MARTRTFIGVDVGGKIRAAAQSVQAELTATGADVKWVDPASMHVTLLFLGDLDDRDLAAVCRAAAKAVAREPGFRLRVEGVGAFPTPRRPKVLWAGIAEGADDLRTLFAKLEEALDPLGVYRKEDRPYSPHLTLGRAKDEAAGALIAPLLPVLAGRAGGAVDVDEVGIYSSELRRAGPEYAVLARCPLGG